MLACTRCGSRHTDVEDAFGKRMSCSEIKAYWITVQREHQNQHGHRALLTTDQNGNWICQTCRRSVGPTKMNPILNLKTGGKSK
jgi:hypothetical protein